MNRRPKLRTALAVVLVACAASLATAAALRWSDGQWEDRTLRKLAAIHAPPGMETAERVLALLHLSHRLVGFANETWSTERPNRSHMLLGAPVQRLLVEGGACGTFSWVLARLLIVSGFETQIVQMRADDTWGRHIVVSTRVDGRWIALDPLYDLAFRDGAGRLASLEDLGADWPRYAAQTPPGYPSDFDYRAIRIANWERIPVVGAAVRRAAEILFGKDAVEQLSPRIYLTNVAKVEAVLLAGAGFGALLGAGGLWRMREGSPAGANRRW